MEEECDIEKMESGFGERGIVESETVKKRKRRL